MSGFVAPPKASGRVDKTRLTRSVVPFSSSVSPTSPPIAEGAGADGAALRDAAGTPAAGATACRDHHHQGGSQPLARRGLPCARRCPALRCARLSRAAPSWPMSAGRSGTSFASRRSARSARQHRALQRPRPADPRARPSVTTTLRPPSASTRTRAAPWRLHGSQRLARYQANGSLQDAHADSRSAA